MKVNRNYITPFISLVFLVVGLSGLLMFFHLFDGYTEVVHELLGVFFLLCAIFHIILNWKPLKIHFKRGVFMPAGLAVAVFSIVFIVLQQLYPKVDTILIERIVKVPINDVCKALQLDPTKVVERLKTNGIVIDSTETMEEIWMKNDVDPEEIFDLIME